MSVSKGLFAELFTGRAFSMLTPDELRAYHREWARRNYAVNRDSINAKQRARPKVRTEKDREYDRRWRAANIERYAAYDLRAKLKQYGLTVAEYQAMYETQNGKCALCSRTNGGRAKYRKLNVDHDHKTGRVRALLCHQCNMMLGHCNDDPELLRKAAAYVEHHTAR